MAFRVSLIYTITSVIYILFSDFIVMYLISDPRTIRIVSIFKGWGFVILSGILIYLLIKLSIKKSALGEERYQLMSDLTQEGIVLHDNGVVIDINNAFLKLTGYSRGDVMGKNIIETIVNKEFRSMCYDSMMHQNPEQFEIRGVKKNGQDAWAQIITKQYRFQGKDIRATLIREITKQKIVEESLKRSEEKYRTLFETMPNGFYRSTPGGYFVDANPAYVKMLGYSSKEELLKIYIPTDIYVHSIERTIMEKNENFINKVEEYRLKTKDGRIIYIEDNARYIKDENGKVLFHEGICRDITERKQAEEELIKAKAKAEESDHLKSVFLANMSHEIRTPMNAIMGFSDILDMEDMPFEKRRAFTKTIRERAKDLLNIINDILDISRIESHTIKIIEKRGNINEILHDINNFFELRNEQIYSKPITFSVINELTEEQNFIEADFERIKQILINLIENAFKFTMEGSIKLGCKLKDDNTLLFYLSDTGIGISKEKQNIIFERFRQADDTYLTREFSGIGLGLSICKGLVDLMKGSIWVESVQGEGSTFYFTLPYKPVNAKKAGIRQIEKVYHDFSGKTILIVEDINYNKELLVQYLKNTNATLLFAENGVEALESFILHQNIDLVLMDIRLPDINGLDLTKEMRKQRGDIKIIAQTAYASSEDLEKILEVGCVDFVPKPIIQNILLECLDNYL